MVPIIAVYDPKDLAIIVLATVIVLFVLIKIIVVTAYYKGVEDTRKTTNGVLKSDISSFRKLQGQ